MPIEYDDSKRPVKPVNLDSQLTKKLAEAHRQTAQQQSKPRVGIDGRVLPWQPLQPSARR